MPLYDFECADCGHFSRFRALSESSLPCPCPACGELAQKQFPVIHLRSMRPENRKAWERNERSAHAPHQCGTDCAHQKKSKSRSVDGGKPALQGSKKAGSRPWMLGH